MTDIYYGVEPYSGDIVQHFGIPGMKWGWTKDGRKTGAKEAMTEDERKARRQQLLKKVGTALGVAAAVGGTALAIRNRKKLGTASNRLRAKIGTGLDNIKNKIADRYSPSNVNYRRTLGRRDIVDKVRDGISGFRDGISGLSKNKNIKKLKKFGKTAGKTLKTAGSNVSSVFERAGSGLNSLGNIAKANAMRVAYTGKTFKKAGLSGARKFWNQSAKLMRRR